MNYNIAQLMGNDEALKEVFASLHADDKPGFAVPVSVFLFQEVRTVDFPALQQLLNASAPPGVLYAPGTYFNNNEDDFAGAQAMFYRAGMLLEDSSQFANFFTGAGRFTSRWRLRVLGYDSPLAGFFAYSSHLKASNSQADAELRLFGVQQIRNNAHGLGPNQYIIYAGDHNFYHNQEPGYLWWFNPMQFNAGIDPLGTGSWAGPANAIKHSQSPRKISFGGLVGGGMNSRFDFQLTTVRFGDGVGLSRIPGTYRSFGNDGLKFNEAINFGNNFYYPNDVPRSNAVANALHGASDHVPVVVDYQLPARMAATIMPTNFGTVIQGADVQINFSVTNNVNTAHVVTPIGAEMLQFTATGGGAIQGMLSDTVAALSPPATGSMTLSTSGANPGVVSGTITFTSPNEAVQPQQIVRTATGNVIAPSLPSFSGAELDQSKTIEIDFDPGTGIHPIEVSVFNFAISGLNPGEQASMNVLGVGGLSDDDALHFLPPPPEVIDIAPGDAQTLIFLYDTAIDEPGVHIFELTVNTTDEDLPGAALTNLPLTIVIGLGATTSCVGDLTGSGSVGVPDLLALLSAWGPCPDEPAPCPADLTGSGSVGVPDLLQLLANWGPCPR